MKEVYSSDKMVAKERRIDEIKIAAIQQSDEIDCPGTNLGFVPVTEIKLGF